MVPKLTAGSINRIFNRLHVQGAIIQIIDYYKTHSNDTDCYLLLISDGVTLTPFAMLNIDLNSLITNRKLEPCVIVRVDEYVCDLVHSGAQVINLLSLTVLTYGVDVGKKLGNPVCVSEPQTMRILPELTSGSINRILNGEDVSGAVMQILGCKKAPGTFENRYRIIISDGVTSFIFAMLSSRLNSMAMNKELEKFTVVLVDKYTCNQVQSGQKTITLVNLIVLAYGEVVAQKLGNPVISTVMSINATNESGTSINTQYECSQKTMLPQLTVGSIHRIFNCEDVPEVIVQILAYRKIPDTYYYRLLISDGVTCSSFTILSTLLTTLITSHELEVFTIVRIDKYVCNQVGSDKFIVLSNLSILASGAEVGKKLGNPKTFIFGSEATSKPAGTFSDMDSDTDPESFPANENSNSNNIKSKSIFSIDDGAKALATNETDAYNKSNLKPPFSSTTEVKSLATKETGTCNKRDSKPGLTGNPESKALATNNTDTYDLKILGLDIGETLESSSTTLTNATHETDISSNTSCYISSTELTEFIVNLLQR